MRGQYKGSDRENRGPIEKSGSGHLFMNGHISGGTRLVMRISVKFGHQGQSFRRLKMLFLIIWVLCAVLCGVVANQKKLNVALWSVLGLLFGVFAVIGVFVQKPKN